MEVESMYKDIERKKARLKEYDVKLNERSKEYVYLRMAYQYE